MEPTVEVVSVTRTDAAPAMAVFSRSARAGYTDVDGACEQLRAYLADRTNHFEIRVQKEHGNDVSQNTVLNCAADLLSGATGHTKNPSEGDYIKFHMNYFGYSISYFYDDDYLYLTIAYTVDYFTTAAQEEVMDAAVEQVVQQLGLNVLSDEGKVCRIYEYITEHVSYDHAGLNDENDLLKYSAYGALIEGSSVCQGYASLFYRLALECGVDARVISGLGVTGTSQGRHAWNIVKLNDRYYNLDATWDAERAIHGVDYAYFLKSGSNFTDHIRDPQYDDSTFHTLYPMAAEDYDRNMIPDTVIQGDFVFSLDGTGAVLQSYTGTGAAVEIPSQVDGKPVYAIGERAFYEYKKLASVILPASVRTLGRSCFALCEGLTSVTFTGDVPVIESNAFSGVKAACYYPDGNATWSSAVKQNYGGTITWKSCIPVSAPLPAPVFTVTNRASDGKPTISWTAVEGATGYEVWRCGTSGGTYTKLITTAADKLSVTHTGAAVGNDYFYKVKALYGPNPSCNSALTAAKGVWVDLKQPTVKVLNSVSTGKPVIQWEKVDYAVGYKVYMSETSGGTYKEIYSTTNPDKLSVTHTGAKAENDYFYKVVAVHKNSKCNSAMSAAKGVWCDLARTTANVSLNAKNKPYISWSKISGADKYEVYVSTNGGAYRLLYTAPSTKLDLTHTGAVSGSTYTYKVRAVSTTNSKANGSYSVVKSVTVP